MSIEKCVDLYFHYFTQRIMKRKSLIVRIPKGCEDISIIKEYVLDDDITIQIIVDDAFEEAGTCAHSSSKVFFCYQDRQKTRFNPYDYSYIEAVGNHCAIWMPIDKDKPQIVISIKSLGELLSQMHKFGVSCFWRVHASYAVNSHSIRDYKDGQIIVGGKKGRIPVSEQYRKELDQKICIIRYSDGS